MMKSDLTIPEIGMIAATRGMLGAGIGLLLAVGSTTAGAGRSAARCWHWVR